MSELELLDCRIGRARWAAGKAKLAGESWAQLYWLTVANALKRKRAAEFKLASY